jgi:hypothetical protein
MHTTVRRPNKLAIIKFRTSLNLLRISTMMILFYVVFASHTTNAKSTSILSITAFFYIFVIHSLLSYAIILFCALLGAVSLN